MASSMFFRASSSVSPAEAQPGSSGQVAEKLPTLGVEFKHNAELHDCSIGRTRSQQATRIAGSIRTLALFTTRDTLAIGPKIRPSLMGRLSHL
jgi:hypothetical protein